MDVMFLLTDLTAVQVNLIKTLLQAQPPRNEEVETRFPNLLLVFNDAAQLVYVVSRELFASRMLEEDVQFGNMVPRLPFFAVFLESQLIKYRTLSGTTFFTFGNLFGMSSILLGPRFAEFKSSPEFLQMVDRKLKMLTLCAVAPQVKVVSWEYV